MNSTCEERSQLPIVVNAVSMRLEYEVGGALDKIFASWGSRIEVRTEDDSNKMERAMASGEPEAESLLDITDKAGKSPICSS